MHQKRFPTLSARSHTWALYGHTTLRDFTLFHTRSHTQTLYGHTGTVTGLFVYGRHIISCSTDRTIRVWAEVEGRGNLAYPW